MMKVPAWYQALPEEGQRTVLQFTRAKQGEVEALKGQLALLHREISAQQAHAEQQAADSRRIIENRDAEIRRLEAALAKRPAQPRAALEMAEELECWYGLIFLLLRGVSRIGKQFGGGGTTDSTDYTEGEGA